ncbi:MAG: hypothetical protein ACWGKN_07705 [Desulfoprunum sp.]|nr:hypothetical protein JT06_16925 [Desulfobulbus sp. Tol-SR]
MIHTADNTTKRFLLGALALVLVLASPLPTTARTDRDIHVSLPPAIVYAEPPQLIVLPETYVYVVPDLEMDVFFYDGWWWRPWEGRWYRSRSYDTGWSDYNGVPTFYREIPSTWRNDYREHRWRGHRWDIQPIPHQQVQQNWSSWEKNRHWEKQHTWGVQDLQIRPQSGQPDRQMHPQIRPQSGQPDRQMQPQNSRKNLNSQGNQQKAKPGNQGHKKN